MTSAFATLNGVNIVGGTLVVPNVGMWTADVALATDEAETGTCEMVLGNLTLQGTIYRATPFAGQTRARIVGGSAGWRKVLPAKAYTNASGVSLRMILTDAANECGEKINLATDTQVGPFYARLGPTPSSPNDGKASASLRAFCPRWYVDTSGMTQIAAWPVATVTSSFQVTDQRPDEGMVEIATEDYASWLPGASFTAPNLDGTFQSFGSHYTFRPDGTFRLQILTDESQDRLLGPLQSVIDLRMSGVRFLGKYRYTISNPTLTTVDATPMDATMGLPSLQGVPLNSDSISTYVPPAGGECHIEFLDGKPTLPRCSWTSGTSTVVNVMGGENPVARLGDQTQSFLPPTLMLSCTSATIGPFTALATIPNPISGSITQGSPSANVP